MATRKHERELAEWAALADGSLPASERPAAEERAASSPEARAAVAEQRRAVAAVRGLSEPAPPRLRERIEADYRRTRRTDRPPARRVRTGARGRAPIGWGLATGATVAAAVLILLFALPGGGPGAPTAAAAAALALRPVTSPASPTVPPSSLLKVRAAGVPYPDWSREYGWRPIGTRTDGIGDRTATTVFYRHAGQVIAYTIVSGAPLALPTAAAPQRHEGTDLHLFAAGPRSVVEWTRLGHTCLLSSAVAPAATLVDLATWRGGGAVPF